MIDNPKTFQIITITKDYVLRKFILIAACFSLATSIIVNKSNELDVETIEFEPIIIRGGDVDLFEIIDDDSINRGEMNKMIDEIWPAGTRRPSR